ncbi:branched-chain amino acid ABC transporter permease [Lampropedia aestuarii]|uniref:Branched-chain amino acid ABC transporter permease n=1 Tax=Lampropedia aestuarii TaxID=2562762 RepID=A0A4S5BP75_9BURK|nr:branched-chain amino acid ABC transporter permease [Lampropedia aestuarii]
MQVFAQLTVNGISVGAIYALVALGVVLIYKATEVLNFAHGDFLVIAAFSAWGLISVVGLPFWLAVFITLAITAVLAYGLDALVIRRIAGQPQFAGVMLTIALAFMIRGLVSMVFGPESRNYPTPWTNGTTSIGGLQIADLQLVILGMAMAVTVLLYVFFRHTRLGIAMQAASQNQLAAYLNGVRVKRVNSLVWALAGAIAALAGVLLAPITLVDTSLWLVTLKALAALVLGGFGSIPGAILGGLLIGLIEQYAGVYMPQGSKDIVAYLALILVLIFRPQGLLGEAHGRRV